VNYRHAFHAGNFADVMKHALLARVLAHLQRKDTAFRAIDTHAGLGFYDLEADEAARTGEWRDGIGRLDAPLDGEAEALLAPYRRALAAVRTRHGPTVYPGSPALIREFLRSQDRGVFNELHPTDGAVLRGRYNADPRTKVLALDGWTALHALIPPRERRGLVLVDPPYEARDEHARLARELAKAAAKWPTGILLGWYPIKDARAVEAMAAALSASVTRPALRLELLLAPPDGLRLVGSGLLVVNPPWTLAEEARVLLTALADRLAARGSVRIAPLGAPA
jgi:23S rRNA (adenine2030-N6)-methyltransferase